MKGSPGAFRFLLVLFLSACGIEGLEARVLRVRPDAPTSPPPDGATWATAFPTAVDAVAAADADDELWLAEGTYVGRIYLKPGMSVYGGFAGLETDRDQRNPHEHVGTILGNEVGGEPVVVLLNLGTDKLVQLDGLTMRNPKGGALEVFGSMASVVNCEVRGCSGVLPVGCFSSVLTMKDCRFQSNAVSDISALGAQASRLEISGCAFSESAGGVLVDMTSCTGRVERCLFKHNTGTTTGVRANGGSVEIIGNRFIGNRGTGNFTTVVSISGSGDGLMANNLFAGNIAEDALDRPPAPPANPTHSIVSCSARLARVLNNTFVHNYAFSGHGVTLGLSLVATEVRNNLIAFNDGGIFVRGTADVITHNLLFNGGNDWLGVASDATRAANRVADPDVWELENWLDPRLRPTSPCRNAGTADGLDGFDFDLDGLARIAEGQVDIGAYEYHPGLTAPIAPRRLYVASEGQDTQDGADWAHALGTIAGATTRARESIDAGVAEAVDVWVKEGVYSERIHLPLGVRLFGGFWGTETTLDQRPPGLRHSVIQKPVPAGPAAAPAGPPRPSAGHADHGLVHAEMTGPWTRLDGFEVRGGHDTDGAGIYLYGSSATIANNVVSNNSAIAFGGGLFSRGGAPRLEQNTFVGNLANDGAALCVFTHIPWPTRIFGNVISNNIASPGPAVHFISSVRLGSRFEFANNVLRSNAGDTAIVGIMDATSSLVVNNTLLGNGGGASSPAVLSQGVSLAIANNLVVSNAAGISVQPGPLVTVRSNCVFQSGTPGFNPPELAGENLEVDPLLAYVDPLPHISGSPCMDGGDPAFALPASTDLDGEPRWMGVRPDIGADEVLPAGRERVALAPVTLETAGGVGYAVWEFDCLSCERVVSSAVLGEFRVTLELTPESTLQPGNGCPAVCVYLKGATPLGVLPPGDYRVDVISAGQPVKTLAATVRATDQSTLLLSGDGPNLKLHVNGLPWARYILESGLNLGGWSAFHTNDGAPFELIFPNDGAALRGIRARILPP